MAKETLKEENKRLTQELKEARSQVELLMKEVSRLNNEANAAYEHSSFYKADQACIRDLKQQVEMLKSQLSHSRKEREKASEEIRLLAIEKNVAVERMADAQNSSNVYKINMLSEELETVYRENRELRVENEALRKSKPVHNERNAGRKKNDAAWIKKYVEFCSLVKDGKTMADIMGKMQISRSTYFRFMKSYKENLELDTVIDTTQKKIRKKNDVPKNNK